MSAPNARPLSKDMVENPPANVAIVEKPPENGKIGIVHLGLGNFARAHWATIIDDLPADQKGDWGISGVSMRSPTIRDQMEPQDNLYTVTERRAEGDKTRIVSAVKETLVAPNERQRVIDRLAHPDTKVISMTITQNGYVFGEDGNFDPANPSVVAELEGIAPVATMPGLVVEALQRRKDAGLPPFTVVSLDNIPNNGDLTKKIITQYAEQRGGIARGLGSGTDKMTFGATDLVRYINDQVKFPNSMVDRITPSATEQDVAALAEAHGIKDAAPIFTEPFRQLVIEDEFVDGTKPPIDDVSGVKLTDDVHAFEAAKIKMLNGAHMMMGALGRVAGFKMVDEVMADPDMNAFTRRFLSEVAATIDPIPGTDMQVYADDLVERFDNPQLKDSVDRLANDTSKKLYPRLVKAIQASLTKGTPNDALGVALAGWQRFIHGGPEVKTTVNAQDQAVGVTDDGRTYVINDPRAIELQEVARYQGAKVHRLHEKMGFDLGMYGKDGQRLKQRVAGALEHMLKGDSMTAIRAVTMRLDDLPAPVVPKGDSNADGAKPPRQDGPDTGPKLS